LCLTFILLKFRNFCSIVHVLNFDSYCELLQVMIDFQAAEKKRVDEPASDIGLEPLCAMVCQKIWLFWWHYFFLPFSDEYLYVNIDYR
jgi:hypothetical protein